MKKRRFSRIRVDEQCLLEYGGRSFTGRLLDISLHGALIEFRDDVRFHKGGRWSLALSLGNPDFVMRFGAEVVHESAGKVGVRFFEADLNTLFYLRNLLEKRIGDHRMLGRELDRLLGDGLLRPFSPSV